MTSKYPYYCSAAAVPGYIMYPNWNVSKKNCLLLQCYCSAEMWAPLLQCLLQRSAHISALQHALQCLGIAVSTPRLCYFGLIQAIHSIPTLPMPHCKYNEWFCKVEIWIHHSWPMPHPYFWVVGGDDFGSSTRGFTQRWSVVGLILQFHSISTLPTSHYNYDEWLEKVEIGVCAL